MKTLYLIRHATAEDGGNSPMFRDFDRELTSTGIIQAARVGKYVVEKGHKLDLIISSMASRALETAKIMAEQWGIDADEIQQSETLYGGGARAYLAALNAVDESVESVAIVGHNPDISFFGEYLTRDDTGGQMEKSAVLVLTFGGIKWSEISNKSGSVQTRYSPQSIKESQE